MAYLATTRPLPLATVIDLKGGPDDVLPRLQRLGLRDPAPGRRFSVGPLDLLRVGREHWWLLAPLEQEGPLLAALLESPPAADTLVLAVSDAWQFLAIDGLQARELIAIACPLDVHPAVFPAEGATLTEVFGQRALLMRRGDGFELAVERSYSAMLLDYFSRVNPA